jgi:hypothetical protein
MNFTNAVKLAQKKCNTVSDMEGITQILYSDSNKSQNKENSSLHCIFYLQITIRQYESGKL